MSKTTRLPQLSIVINTKNVESILEKCLVSIEDFADEVVVMDMHSTDGTLALAKKLGAKTFTTKKDYGYVEPARNEAIAKASGDWILILDADEQLSESLKQKIAEVITADETTVEVPRAYKIPRKNIIFNQWVKTGWWPDYQLRLFRKGAVEWSNKIHQDPVVTGQLEYFPAEEKYAILHENYQSISQFLERMNRYTDIEAANTFNNPDFSAQFTSAHVIKSFSDEFLRRCFAQGGVDEGLHGVGLSYLQSMYQSVSLLKAWQLQGFPVSAGDQPKTIRSLKNFQSDLNYWIADWQVRHSTGVIKLYWQVRRKFRI